MKHEIEESFVVHEWVSGSGFCVCIEGSLSNISTNPFESWRLILLSVNPGQEVNYWPRNDDPQRRSAWPIGPYLYETYVYYGQIGSSEHRSIRIWLNLSGVADLYDQVVDVIEVIQAKIAEYREENGQK